jgi:hypothetical protein
MNISPFNLDNHDPAYPEPDVLVFPGSKNSTVNRD